MPILIVLIIANLLVPLNAFAGKDHEKWMSKLHGTSHNVLCQLGYASPVSERSKEFDQCDDNDDYECPFYNDDYQDEDSYKPMDLFESYTPDDHYFDYDEYLNMNNRKNILHPGDDRGVDIDDKDDLFYQRKAFGRLKHTKHRASKDKRLLARLCAGMHGMSQKQMRVHALSIIQNRDKTTLPSAIETKKLLHRIDKLSRFMKTKQ